MNAPAHAETATTTAAWVPLATAAARPLAVLQLARPATGATAHKTKHYCRNPRCRSRLPEPVENEHRAFCTRGCYESFYWNRCRACERDLRKTGKPGDAHRLYCRPPNRCAAEARKWPEKYGFGARPVRPPTFRTTNVRNADEMGLKIGPAGDRPIAHHLRGWWWGGNGEHDHSLYNGEGLTIGRVVLEGDGRYHLRTPIAIPRRTWAHLEEAKRRAESFALMAIPSAAVDPKLAARIKRDNEAPHPMGPPLNRPPLTSDAISSDWRPTAARDPGPIPDFLRRRR
jgi:hypothetical protein